MPEEPKERSTEEHTAAVTPSAPATPSPPSNAAPPPKPAPPNLIPVKIVDARPPFPLLWTLSLSAVPRAGDSIMIGVEGRPVLYTVNFATFNPFDNVAHVTLGCLPNDAVNNSSVVSDASLQQRMDAYIKSQAQLFDRAESYSKVIILLGYAGTFGLWNFAKDVMSPRATEWSAILVGISLLIYVSWEIVAMIYRAIIHYRFNTLIHKTPADFFKSLDEFHKKQRLVAPRDVTAWLVCLIVTMLFGYIGAFLLLYNCLVKLTGLPPLP